jgi:hypothetical protein
LKGSGKKGSGFREYRFPNLLPSLQSLVFVFNDTLTFNS